MLVVKLVVSPFKVVPSALFYSGILQWNILRVGQSFFGLVISRYQDVLVMVALVPTIDGCQTGSPLTMEDGR